MGRPPLHSRAACRAGHPVAQRRPPRHQGRSLAGAMGPRRRAENAGPTITFDVLARHRYITGFRKRRQERRKKGWAEVMDAERQDRISVKWERREDIKRQWKEVQWAERRVDRLMGAKQEALTDAAEGGEGKRKRRREVPALLPAPSEATNGEQAAITVAFDLEDDDPFGGCEVTTTVGGVAGDGADGGAASGSATGPLWPMLPTERIAGILARTAKVRDPGEDDETRRKRRAEALRKEEEIRQRATARKVAKQMALKKMSGKKKKKTTGKKGKGKRPGAKARRRRK